MRSLRQIESIFTAGFIGTLLAIAKIGSSGGIHCQSHQQEKRAQNVSKTQFSHSLPSVSVSKKTKRQVTTRPTTRQVFKIVRFDFSYCKTRTVPIFHLKKINILCQVKSQVHLNNLGIDTEDRTSKVRVHSVSTIHEYLWRVCMRVLLPKDSTCETRFHSIYRSYPSSEGDRQVVNIFYNEIVSLRNTMRAFKKNSKR